VRERIRSALSQEHCRNRDDLDSVNNSPSNRGANVHSICTAAALYPIDTIKTRMQMARTGGGVRALFKSGGGKALYAGAALIRGT